MIPTRFIWSSMTLCWVISHGTAHDVDIQEQNWLHDATHSFLLRRSLMSTYQVCHKEGDGYIRRQVTSFGLHFHLSQHPGDRQVGDLISSTDGSGNMLRLDANCQPVPVVADTTTSCDSDGVVVCASDGSTDQTFDSPCLADAVGATFRCYGSCPCPECSCASYIDEVCDMYGKTISNAGCAACARATVDCDGACPCT